jgi:hypothetical protein
MDIQDLQSCMNNVAFDENSTSNWLALELELSKWREPLSGGDLDCDFVDDNLELLLENHASLLRSIFQISKMNPSQHTSRCIAAAKEVFCRIVGAIERASIVARIRGETLLSPCFTPTSPEFGSRGSAISPVVFRCS